MRPLRFGISLRDTPSLEGLRGAAAAAEAAGYGTLLFADHLGAPAPLVLAASAAAVTDRIRVATHVLSNDFRHPALLAHEAATLDLMSGGRLELGMGAGWALHEYAAAGIGFDAGSVRIARLEESLRVLRRLFAGEEVDHDGEHYRLAGLRLEPLPAQGGDLPILVGGNGDALLGVAARHADIVQFTGFTHTGAGFDTTHSTEAGLAGRIDVVRAAAGERFDALELGMLIQWVIISDDADSVFADLVRRGHDEATVRDNAHLIVGTADEVAQRFVDLRDRLGISYFAVFDGRCEGLEALVGELAGA